VAHSICAFLKPKIKEYVDSRRESFRWFSRQTGVDNTTIYRLVDGSQKNLSFLNASKILKILEPQSYLNVLADYYPAEAKEYVAVGPERAEALIAYLAKDTHLYRVFVFAATLNATSPQVKEKFGSDGLKRVEKLVELGILSEVGGAYVDNLKGIAFPSEEILKLVSVHHFDFVSLDTPGTSLENFRGAVDEDGVREIYRITSEYKEKFHEVLDKRKGNNVVVGSLIVGPVE
jgi:hypothetical protein